MRFPIAHVIDFEVKSFGPAAYSPMSNHARGKLRDCMKLAIEDENAQNRNTEKGT